MEITAEHINRGNKTNFFHPIALALCEKFSAAEVHFDYAYVWEYGKKSIIYFSDEVGHKLLNFYLTGKLEPFTLEWI